MPSVVNTNISMLTIELMNDERADAALRAAAPARQPRARLAGSVG
jgi:hypothetical protein